MSRIIIILISFIITLRGFSQTEGINQTVTLAGYQFKLFTPYGYEEADPSQIRFLVNFTGDGESSAASTENTVLGKYIKSDGVWDGRVVLSNNDTLFVIVMSIPNYGVIPATYGTAIDAAINLYAKLDKENNTYYAISGYSGGPGRALSTITNSSFTYRNLFKRGTFISPTWIGISDYSWSNGGYWHVWYSNNDPNSGTPPAAATDLYSKLNGTKKITALEVACHCNTIWDSAMTVVGIVDAYRADLTYNSTNNRIRWMLSPDDDGSGNIPDPPDPPAWDTSVYHPLYVDTVYNMGNLTYGKTPEAWFDGSTAPESKLDKEGGIQAELYSPYTFIISLGDSSYGNIKFRVFNEYTTGTVTIQALDSNFQEISSLAYSRGYVGGGGNWSTWNEHFHYLNEPIRYLKFTVANPSTPDIREIQITGLGIVPNTPVRLPEQNPTVRTDPGIKYQGISAIDDRDTAYMVLSNGEAFFGSYRQPENVFVSNYRQDLDRDEQPLALTYYGDLDARKLGFLQRKGVLTQLYYNGAWLGVLPELDSSSAYNSKSISNQYKDIELGADSVDYFNWANGHGSMWKKIATLYANNQSATVPWNVYKTNNTSAGQNKVHIFEIGNEDNKTWQGRIGYHSPEVALEKLKSAYDSIKSVDPTAQVYLGATFYADSAYIKSMYWWNLIKYGSRDLPMDGFCFNQYISDAYEGQPHGGNTNSAVTPEQYKVRNMVQGMRDFRDKWVPGRGINWTEYGFARAGSGSNFKVKVIENIPDTFLMANLNVRLLERVATVENGVDIMYNYFFDTDFSGDFGTMILTTQVLEPGTSAYLGRIRHPNWWWLAQRYNTTKDYKAWSQLLIDGDSTSYSITRRDHLSDPTKKLYFISMGTYEGAEEENVVIDFGVPVSSARLIEFEYGSETGLSTNLTVTNNSVTLPVVDEYPRYIEIILGDVPPDPKYEKFTKPLGTKWNLRTYP